MKVNFYFVIRNILQTFSKMSEVCEIFFHCTVRMQCSLCAISFSWYMHIYLCGCGKTVVVEKHRASDKVVADDEDEKMLIVKHIQRLQVSAWLALSCHSVCIVLLHVRCWLSEKMNQQTLTVVMSYHIMCSLCDAAEHLTSEFDCFDPLLQSWISRWNKHPERGK